MKGCCWDVPKSSPEKGTQLSSGKVQLKVRGLKNISVGTIHDLLGKAPFGSSSQETASFGEVSTEASCSHSYEMPEVTAGSNWIRPLPPQPPHQVPAYAAGA